MKRRRVRFPHLATTIFAAFFSRPSAVASDRSSHAEAVSWKISQSKKRKNEVNM
jgi:hypothetical protein